MANNATYPLSAFIRVWYLFFPHRPLFLVLVFSLPAAAFALWPPRFNQWRPFHLPALLYSPGNQGNLRHQPVKISPHFHTTEKNMVVPFPYSNAYCHKQALFRHAAFAKKSFSTALQPLASSRQLFAIQKQAFSSFLSSCYHTSIMAYFPQCIQPNKYCIFACPPAPFA